MRITKNEKHAGGAVGRGACAVDFLVVLHQKNNNSLLLRSQILYPRVLYTLFAPNLLTLTILYYTIAILYMVDDHLQILFKFQKI